MMSDSAEAPTRFKWQDHSALLVAAVSTGSVSIVLLSVSHGSPQTAYELLRSSAVSSMAFGVTIRTLPIVLSMFFGIAASRLRPREWSDSQRWITAFVLVPLAVVTPLVSLLSVAVLYRALRSESRTGGAVGVRSPRLRRFITAASMATVSIVVWGLILAPNEIWLPREVLSLRGGERVDGYVLRDDSPHIRIIRESDRIVIDLPADELVSRTVCDETDWSWWTRSLVGIFTTPPDYPDCANLVGGES